MPIFNKIIEIKTSQGIKIHNITAQIETVISSTPMQDGQVLVFSRHTTTAFLVFPVFL